MVLLFGMPNMGEMIFLVVIILLLFGGKKLPELARGLGAGIHEFRRGMNQGNEPVQTTQEHIPERDITPVERQESRKPRSLPEPNGARRQTELIDDLLVGPTQNSEPNHLPPHLRRDSLPTSGHGDLQGEYDHTRPLRCAHRLRTRGSASSAPQTPRTRFARRSSQAGTVAREAGRDLGR